MSEKHLSSSSGTTRIARTVPSKARRRTKSTFPAQQPMSSHAANSVSDSHVVHPVPDHKSISSANQAIRSSQKSTALKTGDIYPSFARVALRRTRVPAIGLPVCAGGVSMRDCRTNCQRSPGLLRCFLGIRASVSPNLSSISSTTKDVRQNNLLLAGYFCLASFCLLLERQEGREQKSSARTMAKWHPKPTLGSPYIGPATFGGSAELGNAPAAGLPKVAGPLHRCGHTTNHGRLSRHPTGPRLL